MPNLLYNKSNFTSLSLKFNESQYHYFFFKLLLNILAFITATLLKPYNFILIVWTMDVFKGAFCNQFWVMSVILWIQFILSITNKINNHYLLSIFKALQKRWIFPKIIEICVLPNYSNFVRFFFFLRHIHNNNIIWTLVKYLKLFLNSSSNLKYIWYVIIYMFII